MSISRPTLLGPRVCLRPLRESDAPFILRWRADPAISAQMFSARPPTAEEHAAWFARLQECGNRLEFAIVLRTEDRPVGTIGLSGINRDAGVAEYGILLGEPDLRGRGIAAEASRLLLDFAFHELRLRRMVLRVFSDNEAAIRLYRALGFKPALSDTLDEREFLKDGVRRPVTTMVLLPTAD